MRSKSKKDRAKRRAYDAKRRRRLKADRAAMRHVVPNDQHRLNPLTLFRVGRTAAFFDCDRSTIWRMRKSGKLPPPAFTDPFEAWTFQQLQDVITRRSGG